jgi:uncharacterized protein YdeI (YjbR/CyaY-like superfamily)
MTANTDRRVDAYVSKSAEFAQPILKHLRALVHASCPEVEETIKWSFPHFMYRGQILCSMAAFKAHCAFGFWNGAIVAPRAGALRRQAMGDLGRITSLRDLPSRRALGACVKAGAKLIDAGARRRVEPKHPKPPLRVPADLARALAAKPPAKKHFAAFTPSARRDYVDWIVGAKSAATRERRLATALIWIAEGKRHNWRYERQAGDP